MLVPPMLLLTVLVAAVAVVATEARFAFKHHDNAELGQVLADVHERCPNITRVYALSETSVRGVPLYVVEFSTMPGRHEIRKGFVLYVLLCIT